MSKRSIALIMILLGAILAMAATLDLLAPLGVSGGVLTVFDLPGDRGANRPPGRDFGPLPWHVQLPRGVRAVAGVAALAGYGQLLRYLAARRLATLARALAGDRARMARHCVNGAAALLLLVSLALLATISPIAGPLALPLGLCLALAALSGLTALALPLGQRLRTRVGALEHEPTSDLLTGLLLLVLAALVPYAGFLALALAGLAGLGAVASTRFGAAERFTIEPLDY